MNSIYYDNTKIFYCLILHIIPKLCKVNGTRYQVLFYLNLLLPFQFIIKCIFILFIPNNHCLYTSFLYNILYHIIKYWIINVGILTCWDFECRDYDCRDFDRREFDLSGL